MEGDLDGAAGIAGTDDDVIDPGLIDTGDETPADTTGDGGAGGGEPEAKQFFVKGPGGEKIPVTLNEDGTFDLPEALGKSRDEDGRITQQELQRQLDIQRDKILQEVRGGRGQEKPAVEEEPTLEENPNNWETTENAQSWVRHEVTQLANEVSSGFERMFKAYQELAGIVADIGSGGEKQRLHGEFNTNFSAAVEKAGVPKPTTQQAKEYLDDLREIVMTHPKLKANILIRDKKTGEVDEQATERARREGFTEEQLVTKFYRHYQAATQQGAAITKGKVVTTAQKVLPSPHTQGSGGLPPTAAAGGGKKPIYNEEMRKLPVSISVLRRAGEKATLRG